VSKQSPLRRRDVSRVCNSADSQLSTKSKRPSIQAPSNGLLSSPRSAKAASCGKQQSCRIVVNLAVIERKRRNFRREEVFCSCTSRAEEVWAWHRKPRIPTHVIHPILSPLKSTSNQMLLLVTGSIATGNRTVCSILSSPPYSSYNRADILARKVVEPALATKPSSRISNQSRSSITFLTIQL